MGTSHVLSLTVFVLIMNWIGCYLVDRNEEICKTNGCKRLAKIVKESIDETIDPCHDFYQFACGGYIKSHPPKSYPNGSEIASDMDDHTWEVISSYLKKASKNPEAPPRDKVTARVFELCVKSGQTEMDCAQILFFYGMSRWMDAFFEDHLARRGALKDTMELTDKMIVAYKELINEDKWVEEKTKQDLFDFLSKMNFTNGVAVPIWSPEKLDRFAKKFSPAKAKNWEAFQEALGNFNPDKEFKGWDVGSLLDANSDNNGYIVRIHFGDLQEPKYAPDYPIEWIFGSTGRTIGHEITHSFDPNTFIDPDRPNITLYGDDYKQYYDRANCVAGHFNNATTSIIDHGKNYTFSQNGTVTWGETVSDNMGTRVAFRAYQEEKKRLYGNKESPRLIGFEKYSPEQLFFIGNANYFCGIDSLAELQFRKKQDYHPFPKIRINEGMKDQENFAKAFNCPLNSPMNPEKKCRVWRKRI